MTLGPGHGFGELALMNRTKRFKRAATVTALTPTHLAVLSKEDFQRVCLSQIEKRFDRMLDFLMRFKICEGINKPTLSQLTFFLKERQYKRGYVVYREGERATGIYFIKGGEFEITKVMEQPGVGVKESESERINEFK